VFSTNLRACFTPPVDSDEQEGNISCKMTCSIGVLAADIVPYFGLLRGLPENEVLFLIVGITVKFY